VTERCTDSTLGGLIDTVAVPTRAAVTVTTRAHVCSQSVCILAAEENVCFSALTLLIG